MNEPLPTRAEHQPSARSPTVTDQRLGPARATRVAIALIAGTFLAINCLFLAHTSVRFGADSPEHQANAARLTRGEPLLEHRRANVGYALILALAEFIGVGLPGVVAVQIGVAALAAVALDDMARELGGRGAGLIAAALWANNPDIIRWHSYILTDSLYSSAVIVSVWGIHTAGRRRDFRSFTWAGLIVLATALLRPNGWLLPPIAAGYWLTGGVPRRRAIVLTLVGSLTYASLVVALLTLHPNLSTDPLADRFRQGHVVWGFSDWNQEMPADEWAEESRGLGGVLGYGARHPIPSVRLMAARVLAELAHVRPYYTHRHNWVIGLVLAAVYVTAAVGEVRTRRVPLARLLAVVIVGHLLIVGLTWADWDGRFLLPVLPLIGVFSGCGLVRLATYFGPRP